MNFYRSNLNKMIRRNFTNEYANFRYKILRNFKYKIRTIISQN
ncbi:hypothetical protein UNSWCD_1214 [Campylobacter concisus UNSWCD]|nr:hypothetical protein UNSWCD_1214 [Campylobacter concisus UNSWCD]